MTNPELAERLREAAAHMRKGVHTPAHVALMLEAAAEFDTPVRDTKGLPQEPSEAGLAGKRTSSGMNELSRASQRRSERYEACEDLDAEREGKILEDALAVWGARDEVDVAIEEMSELIKALIKERRNGAAMGNTKYEREIIREEMADVYIMLNQLSLIFGDCSDWEVLKLLRLEARLKEVKKNEDSEIT